MFTSLNNWLIYRAVKCGLRRPVQYPLHHVGESARRNDFFESSLIDVTTDARFFANSAKPTGLEGVVANRNEGNELKPHSISYDRLHEHAFRITHHYRGNSFTYGSALRFFAAELVGFPLWHRWWNILLQRKFNAQTLVRKDRMALLSHFLERTIDKPAYGNSPIGVVTDIYGNRWGDHPDNERIQQYYELLIDSLVESGDLVKDKGIYAKLAPHALVTLEADRQEKERHSENIRIQRRIVWLTVVLAILAAGQIAASVWEELHPDPVASTPQRISAETQ